MSKEEKPNKYNRNKIRLDNPSKLNTILNPYYKIRVMVEDLKK